MLQRVSDLSQAYLAIEESREGGERWVYFSLHEFINKARHKYPISPKLDLVEQLQKISKEEGSVQLLDSQQFKEVYEQKLKHGTCHPDLCEFVCGSGVPTTRIVLTMQALRTLQHMITKVERFDTSDFSLHAGVIIECAKSARSTCETCNQIIDKNEICVGQPVWVERKASLGARRFSGILLVWHHVRCFFNQVCSTTL
jgi:hypothetical protein